MEHINALLNILGFTSVNDDRVIGSFSVKTKAEVIKYFIDNKSDIISYTGLDEFEGFIENKCGQLPELLLNELLKKIAGVVISYSVSNEGHKIVKGKDVGIILFDLEKHEIDELSKSEDIINSNYMMLNDLSCVRVAMEKLIQDNVIEN